MNANSVDFFRFTNGYEDVFVEGEGYLYACADPFGWAHMLSCREVHTAVDLSGRECIYPQAMSGADWQYLETLEPASEDIARRIIDACTEAESDPDAYIDLKYCDLGVKDPSSVSLSCHQFELMGGCTADVDVYTVAAYRPAENEPYDYQVFATEAEALDYIDRHDFIVWDSYGDAMCGTIEGIGQSGGHYECYVNTLAYICGPVEA